MQKPNILIIQTDQQRWDALGANGNRDIQTPNLDRLAGEGVNFDHCFVQNPLCMPSRVSFLTGRYPSSLGITHMGVPVPEELPTLPRLLKPYGYHCANIGKLHFLPHANRDHRQPHPGYGFDHLEISDEPGCYEDAYRAWVRRKAPDQLDFISVGLPPKARMWQEMTGFEDGIRHPEERFPKHPVPFRGRSDLTHSAFVGEQTMEVLRDRKEGEPFLCITGFFSPHSPWVVPQDFLDRYQPETFALPTYPEEAEAQRSEDNFPDKVLRAARHGYYAMVSEVDHYVGKILDTLESSGLAENTIVVFTSDHGDFLGEHLRWGKGYPAPDCISRVPLLIRLPKTMQTKPRTADAIVEAVDVLPTLLECCDIPVPREVQGCPLVSLAEGRTDRHRDSALMEFTGWKSLRTERYQYLTEADGSEMLFDLQAPHGEYRNIAAEQSSVETLSSLRVQLLQRLLQQERPLPRTWPY